MKSFYKVLLVAILFACSIPSHAQWQPNIFNQYVRGLVVNANDTAVGVPNRLVHVWIRNDSLPSVHGRLYHYQVITDSLGFFSQDVFPFGDSIEVAGAFTYGCGRKVSGNARLRRGTGPLIVLKVCDTTVANPCAATPSPVITVVPGIQTYTFKASMPGAPAGTQFMWTSGNLSWAGPRDSITQYIQNGKFEVCVTAQVPGTTCVASACTTFQLNPAPQFGVLTGVFLPGQPNDYVSIELVRINDSTSNYVQSATYRMDTAQFWHIPIGTYLVRVVPTYLQFSQNAIVTYYPKTASWAQATPVTITPGLNPIIYLSLINGDSLNASGIGTINGTVGGNGSGVNPSVRSAQRTIPFEVKRASVLITNTANNLSRATMTDAQGRYGISNLPFGTYRVQVDYPRVNSTAHTITLGPSAPVVTANFNTTQATIATGIAANLGHGLQAYPNPARDQLTVELASSATAEIAIFNSLGQRLTVNLRQEGDRALVNTTDLPAGLYRLVLVQDGKTATASFTKE